MSDVPKAGQKFVWAPPSLIPPKIYVRVNQVRRHGSTVAAECWQGPKHWKRSFPIPLPPSMTPNNWTFEEIGIDV